MLPCRRKQQTAIHQREATNHYEINADSLRDVESYLIFPLIFVGYIKEMDEYWKLCLSFIKLVENLCAYTESPVNTVHSIQIPHRNWCFF